MLRICRTIEKVASSNATVMLLGESGTGKEVLARGFARLRRVVANALGDQLRRHPRQPAGGEAFRLRKGAFTRQDDAGENRGHRGMMLDEIGDLPLSLQAKPCASCRSGSSTDRRAPGNSRWTVRIVCATPRISDALPPKPIPGGFVLPVGGDRCRYPRYARPDGDSALLSHAFVRRFAAEQNRGTMGLGTTPCGRSPPHLAGNVRERKRIKRAVIMADSNQISRADIGLAENASDDDGDLDLRKIRDEAERRAVVTALARANGNVVRAAELLAVSRPRSTI